MPLRLRRPPARRPDGRSKGAIPPPPRRERSSPTATLLIWVLIVFGTVPPTIFTYRYSGPAIEGASVAIAAPEGSVLSRTIWLALLAIGLALTLSRSALVLKLLKRVNPYLLLFYGLIAASILWSIEPAITTKRLITASTIALDGIALAVAGWHYTRFQAVLRPVLTLLLAGCIIFVLVEPEMAIEQSNQLELIGAWHGLTAQKNALGGLAATAFILWWHAWLCRETPPWITVLGAVISGTCLLHSRSSTSIMATAFGCILLLMMLRSPPGLRRYIPYFIALFVVALLLYSLAVLKLVPGSDLLLSPITALTGKDQTFSGRTAIWAVLNEHIALRPLLGSGYGAYWLESPGSPSMIMLQRVYFYPTEGHNGYLDVINDLGALGGVCLLGYLVCFLRQGLRILKAIPGQGALYLTLLFVQMIGNLSESRWFNALDFSFIIMTTATFAMARTLMDLGKTR